ncbi:MAG: 23S rRNA (adenine(2503)-C(2))-methyltransferase RlmN [Chloroflexi bacterium]|nr:23S rRNA (adenine(2503)-C(2))-methyltransferase RlmN [Chloroflexota bacterium]
MINLLDLDQAGLREQIVVWGYPGYRAEQIWRWLYTQKVTRFEEMANLPPDLRDDLTNQAVIGGLETVREILSADGETTKYLFQLPDGQTIETVLMEYDGQRRTACISTQAGCAMGCVFCATGQMGFARHLSSGEIVEQALYVARQLEAQGERLSNVVLMGMGEPFHNYEASLAAIRRIIDPEGLGIGQRHVTISTVGMVPAIRRFAAEGLQVRLAISLHAATDEERSALLPVNKRWPLDELIDAVQDYVGQVGRRVTFEWTSIAQENDTPEQAHQLGQLLQGLLCHVNIIPLNPTQGYSGRKPDAARVDEFVSILSSYGVPATVRVRRGIDINAGCGQLKTAVDLGLA